MQRIFYSVIALSLTVFSCQSTDSNSSKPDQNNEYAYITGIVEKDDSVFLDADYIQYLTGDAAAAAAIKEGNADTSAINGVQHVDVPNDYYILNDSKKNRRLPVAKDCEYHLLTELDRVNTITDNSLTSLKKIYKDSPFLLTISDGKIIRIEEVFIP